MPNLSVVLAFCAGILSFLSPCTLPLVPSYLAFITGVSRQTRSENASSAKQPFDRKAFLHAFFFCLGLSMLFVVLGFGFTAFGSLLRAYRDLVRIGGGAFIVVMGLFMGGAFRSEWLMKERRPLPRTKPVGYLGSFVVGVAFAAGWTPCIGPILGSVLAMILANPGIGTAYMVAYALGFSLPFLAVALTWAAVRPLVQYAAMISRIGGWVLVLMGVLLITNRIAWITSWIQNTTGYSGF